MSQVKVKSELLKGKVAVLLGGNSAEREVSLKSGAAVALAFAEAGLDVLTLDPADKDLSEALREHNIAHAFIAMHGGFGEDGTLQGFLQWQGVSYTGSGVLACAIAMDKNRTKRLWQGYGIDTPPFELLGPDSDLNAIMVDLGGEAFVKPVHEGSSVGMSKVSSPQQLKAAYELASQYDADVMVERFIAGEEYTVAVLDGKALPAIRLETDNEFYDYDAKYVRNDTRYVIPAGLSDEREQEIRNLAEQAFSSLGCKGWARVDVMSDADGRFWLLEINTVPGMTSHSLVPMAAKAVGLTFTDLVLTIFNDSLGQGDE